jgi:hypothetical protein
MGFFTYSAHLFFNEKFINFFLEYSSILINNIHYYEILNNGIVNPTCTSLGTLNQDNSLYSIYTYIYGSDVSYNVFTQQIDNFGGYFFFFLTNYFVVFFSTTVLFLVSIFFLKKKKVFKPFAVLLKKVQWEAEQNLMTVEDFYIVLLFYVFYLVNFGSLFVHQLQISYIFFFFSKLICFFFSILVMLLPIFFFKKTGIFMFFYIKGVSNDNNLYVSAVNDMMGKLSVVLRYSVQSIRWFLFFLFFFIFQIFLYEIKYFYMFDSVLSNGTQFSYTIGGLNINIFIYILQTLFRVIFELVDFFFVMAVQLSAFIVVLF